MFKKKSSPCRRTKIKLSFCNPLDAVLPLKFDWFKLNNCLFSIVYLYIYISKKKLCQKSQQSFIFYSLNYLKYFRVFISK